MPWLTPAKEDVALVYVYPGAMGFRYTCRDHEGKVIYEAPRGFRSRFDARKEAKRRWPEAKVSFEA